VAVQEILLLGDPRLYEVARPVTREDLPAVRRTVPDLHDTLLDYRRRHGAGRAVAAPQIGVPLRLLYLYIEQPVVFINPILTPLGEEMMEVWDDCMCFPGLLVKVRRYRRCRIEFRDLDWREQSLDLAGDRSELLQHEYDHLDGILAVMRAIDGKSFRLQDPCA